MRYLGIARKTASILANLSLFLNTFLPFVIVAQPTYAQTPEETAPVIVEVSPTPSADPTPENSPTPSEQPSVTPTITPTQEKAVDSKKTDYLNRSFGQHQLTLMTCWPPGTTLKQLLVTATLKNDP